MKKIVMAKERSVVVNGSTSNYLLKKDAPSELSFESWIAAIRTSLIKSNVTASKESTIPARQITKHTSGKNTPSTKACGLYRTLNFKTSWNCICMPIMRHGLSREGLGIMIATSPTFPRTRSIAGSKVPMAEELRHIECENGSGEGSQDLLPSPGRI